MLESQINVKSQKGHVLGNSSLVDVSELPNQVVPDEPKHSSPASFQGIDNNWCKHKYPKADITVAPPDGSGDLQTRRYSIRKGSGVFLPTIQQVDKLTS